MSAHRNNALLTSFTQMGPIQSAVESTFHQRREAAFDALAWPALPDFHCPEGYLNCGVREGGAVCTTGCHASNMCSSRGPADPRLAGDGLVPIAHPPPEGMGWCGGCVQAFVPAGQNFSRECMGEMPPSRRSGAHAMN